MTKRNQAVAIVATCWLLCSPLAQAAKDGEAIRFAPLPMENREAMVKAFNPLVTYLESQLGRPVTLVYYDSNTGVVDAFANNQVDLAFVGPLPYLVIRQKNKAAEPLVFFREADGSTRYTCALVSFSDSKLKMSDLKNKRIGLTERLSTCGYLGAHAILSKQAGIQLGEANYQYVGSHEGVMRAVVAGKVDIGVVKEEFAHKYATLGTTILARSEPVPGVGIAGNGNTLDAATLDKIRSLLLATPKTTYERWGATIRHGMQTATDREFDALRSFGDINAIPPAPTPAKPVP